MKRIYESNSKRKRKRKSVWDEHFWFLEASGINRANCIVELNGEIIRREKFWSGPLSDGDRIEIFSCRGGWWNPIIFPRTHRHHGSSKEEISLHSRSRGARLKSRSLPRQSRDNKIFISLISTKSSHPISTDSNTSGIRSGCQKLKLLKQILSESILNCNCQKKKKKSEISNEKLNCYRKLILDQIDIIVSTSVADQRRCWRNSVCDERKISLHRSFGLAELITDGNETIAGIWNELHVGGTSEVVPNWNNFNKGRVHSAAQAAAPDNVAPLKTLWGSFSNVFNLSAPEWDLNPLTATWPLKQRVSHFATLSWKPNFNICHSRPIKRWWLQPIY